MGEDTIARMKRIPKDSLIHEIELRDYLIEEWKKEAELLKSMVDLLMRRLAKEWDIN